MRAAFILGNLALLILALQLWMATDGNWDLPRTDFKALLYGLGLVMSMVIGALIVGLYLTIFLGVDVFGLKTMARLFGAHLPEGRPFDGLTPGEVIVLRFDFSQGGLNRDMGFRGLFKLLLTDRRLLVGANLTSWYLAAFNLEELEAVRVTDSLVRAQRGRDPRNPNIVLESARKREEFIRALENLSVQVL